MTGPFEICGSDGADRVELLRKLDFANVFHANLSDCHLLKLLWQARLGQLLPPRIRAGGDCTCIASFLLNLASLADAVADERTVCSCSWRLRMGGLVVAYLRLDAGVDVLQVGLY